MLYMVVLTVLLGGWTMATTFPTKRPSKRSLKAHWAPDGSVIVTVAMPPRGPSGYKWIRLKLGDLEQLTPDYVEGSGWGYTEKEAITNSDLVAGWQYRTPLPDNVIPLRR